MKIKSIFFIFITVFLLLILFIAISFSKENDNSFLYIKISSDKDGITHFTEIRADLFPFGYMDMYSSAKMETKTICIFRAPPEFVTDWHPAPTKQFVIVLSGAMEVESGDAEKRQFQAGDVLLVEDTTGQGHKTRTVGEKELVCAWVSIN